MSEKREIQLRTEIFAWKVRQDIAGNFTFAAAVLATFAAAFMWSGPSGSRMGMSGLALILAVVFGGGMLYCANRVVMLRLELERGVDSGCDVVDGEVVGESSESVADAEVLEEVVTEVGLGVGAGNGGAMSYPTSQLA